VEQALAPARVAAQKITYVFLSAALLFIVAVLFLLYIIITRPLRSLTESVNAITSGDLRARTRSTSKDEIGILARAFNTMTDTLLETKKKVEEEKAVAEKKVATLERFKKVTIGREIKMIELKKQIAAVTKKEND